MLKGLLFDLDGVVTDSAAYHLAAWNALAKQLGITLPAEANDALRGRSRMDSLNVILAYGDQVDKYTTAEKEAFATQKNDLYRHMIQKMTPADILPGIPKLLADAKAQGLKMTIASASKNAPTILDQLGLTDQFDGIVDPATLHRGKPDPEIFQRAAELVNLGPTEVIGFEDASAGVAAIKAAGMFAVGIGDATVLAAADVIVPDTSDLDLAMIEQHFNKQ